MLAKSAEAIWGTKDGIGSYSVASAGQDALTGDMHVMINGEE